MLVDGNVFWLYKENIQLCIISKMQLVIQNNIPLIIHTNPVKADKHRGSPGTTILVGNLATHIVWGNSFDLWNPLKIMVSLQIHLLGRSCTCIKINGGRSQYCVHRFQVPFHNSTAATDRTVPQPAASLKTCNSSHPVWSVTWCSVNRW